MRQDISFTSGGELCAAWWYPAAGTSEQPAPCVVMAHGFSLTREEGLAPYAEAFARAGVHVLVFDFRFLGDSGGTPRQRFRAPDQREDWRNAVAYVRGRADVDARQLVLWGYSFSGGHVTRLLAEGIDVAAAMVLCPFVDGLKRVLATDPRTVAWMLPRSLADLAGHHNTIPVTGPPGTRAAMSLPGEADGFAAAAAPQTRWQNAISPGLFAGIAAFRPVRGAARITVPLWVGRLDGDITVDAPAVLRLAENAPRGELHEFPGDHFTPFHGEGPRPIIAAQTEFLMRTVAAPQAV